MRCHCCDKILSDGEVQILPDGTFDMCAECLEIALDAAYCDGFEEESLEDELQGPVVPILEVEIFRTVYDCCDPSPDVDEFSS